MKTFLIRIKDHPVSEKESKDCLHSADLYSYKEEIQIFDAITPKRGCKDILGDRPNIFDNYPRPDRVACCFASHYLLWKKCIELNEPILILEHDAIFIDEFPDVEFDMCCTFGEPTYYQPQYIDFDTPKIDGVQILTDKNFLGHHAYAMKPAAAKIFVEDCDTTVLSPNDLWMTKEKYPWLQEYRPFPISAQRSVSTVQDLVDPESQIHASYEDYFFVHEKEKQEFIKKHYPRAWRGQDTGYDHIKI